MTSRGHDTEPSHTKGSAASDQAEKNGSVKKVLLQKEGRYANSRLKRVS